MSNLYTVIKYPVNGSSQVSRKTEIEMDIFLKGLTCDDRLPYRIMYDSKIYKIDTDSELELLVARFT